MASKRTLKRRADEIGRFRSLVSGGDTCVQMGAEIKYLSQEHREKILLRAQLPLKIPSDHALAMKAGLAIPWNKLRELKRYCT